MKVILLIKNESAINRFLQPYIIDKYNYLAEEILNKVISNDSYYDSLGIKFKTRFDEFIFITLYERSFIREYREFLLNEIIKMVRLLPNKEINILALKESNDFMTLDIYEKEDFIVREIITCINNILISHLFGIAEKKYWFYTNRIIEGIKDFAFDGSICGDYPSENYWEDFCIITQEDYEGLYDICWEDIYTYIYQTLSKSSTSDLIILYSGTEEIDTDVYIEPFSCMSNSELIESIASKLYYSISLEATSQDINYLLFPEDDYEDY
jgi:hypothetical protein